MGMSSGVASFHLERRQSSYLFIDGAYLREQYRKLIDPVLGDGGELEYQKISRSFDCAKAYYYDCLDEKKRDETDADFDSRRKAQEELFNRIREVPGFHVRTGTLSGRRQKEVDVTLAVDMLTHAFYKNVSRAVLIAGDLDFRPVVDSLVRLGTWVEVASVRTTTAKPLQWAADQHRELTFSDFYDWSTEKFRSCHPIPRRDIGSEGWVPQGWDLKRSGRFNDNQALLLERGDNLKIQFMPAGQTNVNTLTFPGDFELLERYFEAMFGHIEWQP
jgi:uncharacterized LabA/DUF88 family protein